MSQNKKRFDGKKWLTGNKIYFETVTGLMLSVMAVIVSVSQCKVSQYEIDLHKKEQSPLFHIRYEYIKTDSSEKYDTKILEVLNEGTAVKEFKYEESVFYKFSSDGIDLIHPYAQAQTVYVPVYGFFLAHFPSGNFTGQLYKAFCYGNNSSFADAYRYCLNLSKKKKSVNLELMVYFEFRYIDIHGEAHTSYFNTSGAEITEEDYKTGLEIANKQFAGCGVSMNNITERFIDSVLSANIK